MVKNSTSELISIVIKDKQCTVVHINPIQIVKQVTGNSSGELTGCSMGEWIKHMHPHEHLWWVIMFKVPMEFQQVYHTTLTLLLKRMTINLKVKPWDLNGRIPKEHEEAQENENQWKLTRSTYEVGCIIPENRNTKTMRSSCKLSEQ